MAISKERKRELVAQYNGLLKDSVGIIITEYRGLKTTDLDMLRARLREVGGQYVITKNSLLKIALEESGWPVPQEQLLGPVAIAFADGNFPGLAKAILGFAKDREDVLVVKGGILTGEVMASQKIKAISELPSFDELRAQLAGLMVQPATGVVSLLNAATAQVVNVIHAYVQEQGGQEAA